MPIATNRRVVGSTPISFASPSGGQRVVPLTALEFVGSVLGIVPAWQTSLDASEQSILLALAKARTAIGELTPPPVPPPAPALALTARHAGPEGNRITVTAAVEKDAPVLAAKITLSAVEVDEWAGLVDGKAAAKAIGVDAPTGANGAPTGATGLIAVKVDSTGASTKPAIAQDGVLEEATPVDLKDEDGAVVCRIVPRADYAGKDGLSFAVTRQGATFTVTATYDSKKEKETPAPVTLLTLDELGAPVAYVVSATSPPRGASLPADGSTQLSGGGAGRAAGGLLYA